MKDKIQTLFNELLEKGTITNIEPELRDALTEKLKQESKNNTIESYQIGDMMHSKEYGIVAIINQKDLKILMNDRDRQLFYSAV